MTPFPKNLLHTHTQMFEAGKVAESELFEIRSGLALKNSMLQLERHIENVRLKQKIMDIEMSKLEGGRSNIIEVLEKEKNLNQARNGKLRAIVNLELTSVALASIEGSLLQRFGVAIDKWFDRTNIETRHALSLC